MTETNSVNATQFDRLAILRIILGLIILYKSVTFLFNTATLASLTEQTGIDVFSQNAKVLSFIVAYFGLLCGIFITLGLLTRLASIIQIPVLIVAVFFVNIKNVNSNTFEFILSLIALILLIIFAVKGSGGLSLDKYFRKGAARDRKARE